MTPTPADMERAREQAVAVAKALDEHRGATERYCTGCVDIILSALTAAGAEGELRGIKRATEAILGVRSVEEVRRRIAELTGE